MMDTAVACQICRREQLRSACCGGALLLPRRPCRLRHHPDGMDLISALPDDLIFQFLVRLRCARAAAHTSLLSRRWRGLWTRLPELTFHNIAPDRLYAALAMATAPALSLLEIQVFDHHSIASTGIASLIQAAARLAPAKLSVYIYGDFPIPRSGFANAVELPCFHRSTSVCLRMSDVRFTLPPAGDFPVLESLSLSSCHIDLADLLPRCPKLRKLWFLSWELHPSIIVHSPTLEELEVCHYGRIQRIDILTPSLKKLRLRAFGGRENEFSLAYSAPVVEELSWECSYSFGNVAFGQIWLLKNLILESSEPAGRSQLANNREITCLQPQRLHPVHVLRLYIGLSDILTGPIRSIEQEISQFLVTKFSSLELKITKQGHVYGAMVLHVLRVSTFIQRLNVELCEVKEEETCSVNCPCDQPNNWRSQIISLAYLKEVEIKGFRGRSHEVDLLNVIFRSATMLERVALYLSCMVSPNTSGCMEVYSISKANPSVECNIYRESGEQVLFA